MKTNFLLSGAVLFTLLALTCPWQAAAKASGHTKKLLLPTQAIDTSCAGFIKRNKIKGSSDCAVSETGTIGKVDGQTYHYALYCLNCGDLEESISGLSIFTRGVASNKQTKLLLERYNIAMDRHYEKPAIAKHSFGTLLHVPIAVDGTRHYNESEYYLLSRNQKGWKLLDSSSWMDISPHCRGIWPDMKTITAKAEASAGEIACEDDKDCCSTGCTAIFKFTVKDGKFVVKSMEIRKEESN